MGQLVRWIVLVVLVWAGQLALFVFHPSQARWLLVSTGHIVASLAAGSILWLAGLIPHWFPPAKDKHFGVVAVLFAFGLGIIVGPVLHMVIITQMQGSETGEETLGEFLAGWLSTIIESAWIPIIAAVDVTRQLSRANAKDPSDEVRWHPAPPGYKR